MFFHCYQHHWSLFHWIFFCIMFCHWLSWQWCWWYHVSFIYFVKIRKKTKFLSSNVYRILGWVPFSFLCESDENGGCYLYVGIFPNRKFKINEPKTNFRKAKTKNKFELLLYTFWRSSFSILPFESIDMKILKVKIYLSWLQTKEMLCFANKKERNCGFKMK